MMMLQRDSGSSLQYAIAQVTGTGGQRGMMRKGQTGKEVDPLLRIRFDWKEEHKKMWICRKGNVSTT
jgi:hypothetical protein